MVRIELLAAQHQREGFDCGEPALNDFSRRVGLYAVVVDAKHDKAKAFYLRLGFVPTLDNPLCLFLPLSTLEKSKNE